MNMTVLGDVRGPEFDGCPDKDGFGNFDSFDGKLDR